MKLYYSPGACSLASHIALSEIGKAFEVEKVDLKTKQTETGADFSKINPKGYVPAVKLASGETLTEGAAILQHLADTNPAAGLAPVAGTLERARINELLTFISSELHKTFSPLFNPTSLDEVKTNARTYLDKRLQTIETQLGDGRAYLTGETFSIADAYLFTIVNWTNFVGMSLDAFPKLKAYQARVSARPAVQAAMRTEGLLTA